MTKSSLHAYLDRTGGLVESPSLEALSRVYLAHLRTFPFETVDVLLEQHPGVELDAVRAKFLDQRRGGYCFEHATLFHSVLTELGYEARLRLGRVGDPTTSTRTHLAVQVTLEGKHYLCDPGFGIPPTTPVALRDRARDRGGVWRHEIHRTDEGEAGPAWELWRERSAGWEHVHTTDALPVRWADVEMGHHWTATSPRSPFRTSLLIARHGVTRDGAPVHTSVSTESVTERRAGEPSRQWDYGTDELPALLARLGVRLGTTEATRLADRVRGLRQGGG